MALHVRALKREFEIRTWANIIANYPYVAVLQMTAGRAWGRTNMKHRILQQSNRLGNVDARFAIPKAAREGALRTKFTGLSELFRSGPCAVVYGASVHDVVEVLKRAKTEIEGSVVIGGRFGHGIITARIWDTILESEGEQAEWAQFVRVLSRTPEFLNVLHTGNRGIVDAFKSASGSARLARVLERAQVSEGPQ